MKINQLIWELLKIWLRHGNLPVYGQTEWQWEIENVDVTEDPDNQYDHEKEPKRILLY
jgi:hypothetical protein